jgi:hypothetical protein
MVKNYMIKTFLYCLNIFNEIILIYNILLYKWSNISIEPNKIKWKSLGYINNNNIFFDFYDKNILYYKNNWSIYVEKLENGFYLYNNQLLIDGTTKFFEKSSINFLLIILIQNNNKYNILLKNNEYIVGNIILSKIFICRYFKYNYLSNFKYFNIKIPYIIKIIDNNINNIEINENQSILLNKNDYSIIPLLQQG